MNKTECKKYLRRGYKKAIAHKKSITPKNIEDEMRNAMKEEAEGYIAYSKIAVRNMQECANDIITLKDLMNEIDILPTIYSERTAIDYSMKF